MNIQVSTAIENEDPNFLTVDQFAQQTGMIEDVDVILTLIEKAEPELDSGIIIDLKETLDEAGHFDACAKSLTALNALIKILGDEYHIVSTTDSDDGEDICFDNSVRFVNRINYYLATGDKNEMLYAVETF